MLGRISLIIMLVFQTAARVHTGIWREASAGYQFRFPRDHASHPEYRLEWWYYTGNLEADDGKRFGYQLTFFRIGVDPDPDNPSRWAVRDLYLAHFAVTDISGGKFIFADRLNRAGVGWAGASTDTYRVWNEDWSARLVGDGMHLLHASHGGIILDLQLTGFKPPVIHGARGISQKGSQPGNASHYYSMTRMPTQGTLRLGGRDTRVRGLSWMDHEFGTSFLEPQQLGWDWFSIQLDDGTDLMLFQLRRTDGSRDVHSSGTLVDAAGRPVGIRTGDFDLQPGRRWRSSSSGATYPVHWRVTLPSCGIDLNVDAALDDQELRTTESMGITYWEGAIEVTGVREGRPARGRGYLEMTGYAGLAMGALFR